MIRRDLILPSDIGVALLVALAGLTEVEREAWVNYHVLGQPCGPGARWKSVLRADQKLRDHFGTPEALRAAA